MCGILGFVNFGNEELLENCADVLAHRGPDDKGVEWFDEWNSGFGHRRLSIIDLSEGGHQPMVSADGRYVITYNGEIFNYKEVNEQLTASNYRLKTKSDTETLLRAYERWGEKCLEKLNGMFAFAVFDRVKGEVFAARDRMGIKPFYYSIRGDSLVFASEIKAILKSGFAEAVPDFFALQTQMHFQVAPFTGFDGIFKLEPGSFLRFFIRPQIIQKEPANFTNSENLKSDELLHPNRNDGYNFEIRKWWEIDVREDGNLVKRDDKRHEMMDKKFPVKRNLIYKRAKTEDELIDELDWLLNDAVRLQMVADVPVGILLSGGLDSSIIAALMRKQNSGPLEAFTIKFSEHDQKFEKLEDDSKWAKKVADLFEFNYSEIIVKPDAEKMLKEMMYHLDEPIADPAAINTYLISKDAKTENIRVLLTGMGGDEIFGGYRKHLACVMAETYRKSAPAFLRNLIRKSFSGLKVASDRQGFKFLRWTKRFLSFASHEPFKRFLLSDLGVLENDFDGLFRESVGYENTYFYRKQKSYFDFPDKNISYLTRMCFCDTKVFLPAHNLTYSDKASMMAGVELRPPLADHRIAEFLFSLPPKYRINGNVQKYLLKKVAERYLPKDVVHRPKAPFGSPLRSWIRGPLASEIDRKLTDENIARRGLFNPEKVREYIMKDRKGKEDNAQMIWRFLATEYWFETFFDEEQKAEAT